MCGPSDSVQNIKHTVGSASLKILHIGLWLNHSAMAKKLPIATATHKTQHRSQMQICPLFLPLLNFMNKNSAFMIMYIYKSKCKNKNHFLAAILEDVNVWAAVSFLPNSGAKVISLSGNSFWVSSVFPLFSSRGRDGEHAVTANSSQQMQPVTVLLVMRPGAAFFSLMVGLCERRREETAAQFFLGGRWNTHFLRPPSSTSTTTKPRLRFLFCLPEYGGRL